MDKELHQQEIEQSHLKGFGGSDAAMFAAIAINGLESLNQTYLKRIAEVMGLRQPKPRFTNEAMENGHKFEDYMAEYFGKGYVREYKMEAEGKAKNFQIFAHCDFWREENNYVCELKWSKSSTEEVYERYYWQLQWYYMLGAKLVYLMHGYDADVNVLQDLTFVSRVKEQAVEQNEVDMATLELGIKTLDEAISEGWKPETTDSETLETCPVAIADYVKELQRIKQERDALDAREKEIKDELSWYMSFESLSSISGEAPDGTALSVSYVRPSKSKTFDSKAYFKAHPVAEEEKEPYMVEKEKAGYVSFTAKAPKNGSVLG